MTAALRSTPAAALLLGAMALSCAHAPEPGQIEAVDRLIAAADGAVLALNELDRQRYATADSLLAAHEGRFERRFADTLGPAEALALGRQWTVLSRAGQMDRDHQRVLDAATTASERLRRLRSDLAGSAIGPERAAALIAAEQRSGQDLERAAQAIMGNYRLLQQAWDRRDTVEALLANADAP